MTHIQTMTDAYIGAIHFTDTGDADQPEAGADLAPLTRMQAYIDCRNFYWAVTEGLGVHPGRIDWSQAGHDLWLTRNGHGVGFWDRDDSTYGATDEGASLKTIFTTLAKAMGGHDAEFEQTAEASGGRA
jgi:hypothetical protein